MIDRQVMGFLKQNKGTLNVFLMFKNSEILYNFFAASSTKSVNDQYESIIGQLSYHTNQQNKRMNKIKNPFVNVTQHLIKIRYLYNIHIIIALQ